MLFWHSQCQKEDTWKNKTSEINCTIKEAAMWDFSTSEANISPSSLWRSGDNLKKKINKQTSLQCYQRKMPIGQSLLGNGDQIWEFKAEVVFTRQICYMVGRVPPVPWGRARLCWSPKAAFADSRAHSVWSIPPWSRHPHRPNKSHTSSGHFSALSHGRSLGWAVHLQIAPSHRSGGIWGRNPIFSVYLREN